MRKTLTWILVAVFGIGFALTANAVRKREPDRRDVEKIMAKIGGEHYPEGIEVDDLGGVDTDYEDDINDKDEILAYYWIFVGELPDDGGYHLIICDNSPEPHYLGYYPLKNRPVECGKGYIAMQVEDVGIEDPITGRMDTKSISLTEAGPTKRLSLPSPKGTPSEFVEAPSMEEVEAKIKAEREEAAEEASSSPSERAASPKLKPEYRSWHINYGGRMITVESAIFVSYERGQVTLKNAKNGNNATIPFRDFSPEDQAYLKKLAK